MNEDPWERLRKLRKALPNTKLQMLFRGQNILGYKHYADDVVDEFVRLSIKNGIDIIRIFDALNDVRNLETAIKATKKYGGICEVAMSYTVSPVPVSYTHLLLSTWAWSISEVISKRCDAVRRWRISSCRAFCSCG